MAVKISGKNVLGLFLNYKTLNRVMLFAILVIEFAVFSQLTPYFFRLNNLFSVGRNIANLGIVAIGQTMCILTGGFDLSVGGSAALAGVVTGWFASSMFGNQPYGIAIFLGMGTVLLVGIINGFLISKVKINPFIATMSMNFILGGAVILITRNAITVNTPAFKFIGATSFGSIKFPLPIVILIGLYIIFGFILKYTSFGRRMYATGGNRDAALISGINVDRSIFFTYVLSSVLAGFGGILLASRIATANPNIGSSYAMESIAAAVLGGTALSGGEGNIWGAFLGVLVTGLLSNGLIMIGVSQAWRDIATGIVLILAIILQITSKNSKGMAA
ncbi:MAG: ABC transporter permease [Spirochaetaceae bacterium]|jgi:ribose/xylose/arabinose/galactoside ABC-type transport system permease subunit|nr:ABC transporter permease [Spirochaetaceae bacterium]